MVWRQLALLTVITGFGCTGLPKPGATARPQAMEDPTEKIAAARVGDKTVVGNVEPLPVSAVGLVYRLAGTGSQAGGEWRAMLERDLRKKKINNTAQYLDDATKSTSLVLVSAVIPPGAKKGDAIDIDVTLPRGSMTTSLKGGLLLECDLATSEQSGNVREAMVKNGESVGASPVMGNTLLIGKTLVRAEGPLVVGSDGSAKLKASVEGEANDTLNAARVWGGGKVLEDRPYYFVLNEKSSHAAMSIAERMNATFQPGGDGRVKLATAMNANVVSISVPAAYRMNHARFLTVARQVPMLPANPDGLYRKRLEAELLEPETAITAAVKLEALGAESQQPLRVAMQHQSPWVRFAAAEALAYLGNTAAAGELAKLAEQQPALRTHALLALATLDDGVSADRLTELMGHPDPAVRYGAFVALRSANERHTAINGKHVKKTFWVHAVAPDSAPLVHLASHTRAEIVLFGKVGELVPPFAFPVGRDFAISAKAGDLQATVTRIVSGKDGAQEVSAKCSMSVAALLTAVGELGGGYAEAVEFVRRADANKVLASAVAVDASPRGFAIMELAALARSDTSLDRANLEVERSGRLDVAVEGGLDLPNAEMEKAPKVFEPPVLAKNPGRIFGAKKHPMDADPEYVPPPTPPTTPADTALNRTGGGRLFGK